MSEEPISFITAVNNDAILKENLLASPALRADSNHEIIIQRNFCSAGKAYNDAVRRAKNDILVFVHQDIWLPENWISSLHVIISAFEARRITWGVIGCFGMSQGGDGVGYLFCNCSGRVLGSANSNGPVQSLDEIVLVMRKRNNLRFDERMPHFHLYGTDICLHAKEAGFANYAMSNYCVHNARSRTKYSREFWICAEYMRNKWKKNLPIVTPCARIYAERIRNEKTRIKGELYSLRMRLAHFRRISLMVERLIAAIKRKGLSRH